MSVEIQTQGFWVVRSVLLPCFPTLNAIMVILWHEFDISYYADVLWAE